MLSVLVLTDAANNLAESATYCRPNDAKRPGLVGLPDFTTSQICPADGSPVDELTNAYPDGWYVRVMFDELLDPSVETLEEIIDDAGEPTGTFAGSIATTKPVTLKCQSVTGNALVNVDYDGYYSPSGNSVTWPLGPSIVIKPNDPTLIATNKECELTLADNITDKDGNQVPAADRGPYKFKIAPISVTALDPSDSGDADAPTAIDGITLFYDNPTIQFNTEVDIDTLCPDADVAPNKGAGDCDGSGLEFAIAGGVCDNATATGSGDFCKSMADCATGDTICGKGVCNLNGAACNTNADCTGAAGTRCDSVYAYSYGALGLDPSFQSYGVGPVNPVPSSTVGTFKFNAGLKLKDRCGSETTMAAGDAADNTAVEFKTNAFKLNRINIANGETSSSMKKPNILFSNVLGTLTPADFTITPAPAAANIASTSGGDLLFVGNFQPGTEYTLAVKPGAKITDAYGDEYTHTAGSTIKWKTAAIALGTTTANNATVTKATPTSTVGVSLAFNAAIDPASFAATTDYTVTNSTGAAQTMTVAASTSSGGASNCTATATGCTINIRANLAPGTYTFTLKKDAALLDILGNTYTQAADKVITFTVKDADPAPPAPQCL